MGGRNQALDGLRGVAAFSVVLSHFCCAFLPGLIPFQTPNLAAITDSPASILYNGRYAVAVFFVLSGYVVASSAAKRVRSVPMNLAARYVRLAVPVFASVLFAWALLKAFPGGLAHLKEVLPHSWLAFSYDGNTPGFLHAVYHGAVGVFVHKASLFNNPLWTIKIEMLASIAIYLIFGLTDGAARWLTVGAYAMGCAVTGHTEYLGFAVGMALCELRGAKFPAWVGWAGLVVGWACGCVFEGIAERQGLAVLPDFFALGANNGFFADLGATGLVVAALTLLPVQKALSQRVPRFLGRLSFPLYLVHVPLLYTVFAYGYGRVPLGLLFAAFVAVALGVAWVFEVLIDAKVMTALKRLPDRLPRLIGGSPVRDRVA